MHKSQELVGKLSLSKLSLVENNQRSSNNFIAI